MLWDSCWSSDVFGVAMTMATIVRQSSSNMEAEDRGGGGFESRQEEEKRSRAIHRPFRPETLTEEAQRQRGKRAENKHACVSMKERERECVCVCVEGGCQEVVVMSFNSMVDGLTREYGGDRGAS